jgi:hypothetical protein
MMMVMGDETESVGVLKEGSMKLTAEDGRLGANPGN